MNGYLTFLQSLSEYQQRAEIGRVVFLPNFWAKEGLEEDLLKAPAVAAFSSELLGVDVSAWKLELRHYAEEPDIIGTPIFDAGQCKAPFSFRYVEALRSLDHLHDDLVVRWMICIDDDQSIVIRTLGASSTREKSCARERLVQLGVDPDTLETVSHNAEMAHKTPYLDYLESLLPQQRREAIYHLAEQAWGEGHERPIGFFNHPKLAPELARLEIRDLGISDFCHMIGPVEFAGSQCSAPLIYPLYDGCDNERFGYYVEVHILAGIGNQPGGGGDIWIKDLWFRIENIDEPESDTVRPLLVP